MYRLLLLLIIIPFINVAQTNDEFLTNFYFKNFYEKGEKTYFEGNLNNAINILTEGINTKSNSMSIYNSYWIRCCHHLRGMIYIELYNNDENGIKSNDKKDLTAYEEQEYLEKAYSDFTIARELQKKSIQADDYWGVNETYTYESWQGQALMKLGTLLDNNLYLDSALIHLSKAHIVLTNPQLRGTDLTQQHYKDFMVILLCKLGINTKLGNNKEVIKDAGMYLEIFEKYDVGTTGFVYYTRGLAKKSAGLSFCSDYKKACKANHKCDEYWEHCD